METLVEIAKRLGIKPNPKMTRAEFVDISQKIGQAYGARDADFDTRYTFYKHGKSRTWNEKQLKANLAYLKTHSVEGVEIFNQESEPVSVDGDDVFVHHSARGGNDIKERLQLDIQLDHPKLPQMIDALDDFIYGRMASYKMTDVDHADRMDTLNIYFPTTIKDDDIRAIYDIVKDYLTPDHHEYLNGYPICVDGVEVKGMKSGPEPLYIPMEKRGDDHWKIREKLYADLGKTLGILAARTKLVGNSSLGQLQAKIEYLDLLYYLVGKEGQNPYKVWNQLGKPDVKPYRLLDVQTRVIETDDILKDLMIFDFGAATNDQLKSFFPTFKNYFKKMSEKAKKRMKEENTEVPVFLDDYGNLVHASTFDNKFSVQINGVNHGMLRFELEKSGELVVYTTFSHGHRYWKYSPTGEVFDDVKTNTEEKE
ncbi:MAG: hypothetical protein II942_01770 [Alphaproteobacteria bacterium]|nr:hypothetical protein [Alphaproteobacteria bacterium]